MNKLQGLIWHKTQTYNQQTNLLTLKEIQKSIQKVCEGFVLTKISNCWNKN